VALVFVYGTLKRGFPLFEKGLPDATFLGACRTVESYPLYIAQDFYGPIMLNKPGEGLPVQGELFEVPDNQLPTLDELESVGSKGSFRSTVVVEPLGGGLRVSAIGFMKDESWLEPLHSDCISDYQDRRFIPAWQR
jgi:gamma-glutamylaminecyclotransferase